VCVCASEKAAVQAAACARSGTLKQNQDTMSVCVCVCVCMCVSILEHMCARVSEHACVCVPVYGGGPGVVNLATHLC